MRNRHDGFASMQNFFHSDLNREWMHMAALDSSQLYWFLRETDQIHQQPVRVPDALHSNLYSKNPFKRTRANVENVVEKVQNGKPLYSHFDLASVGCEVSALESSRGTSNGGMLQLST